MLQLISWRTRTVLIGVVYFAYFWIAIAGTILAQRSDTVDAALAIAIVLPTLHFASTVGDMAWGERPVPPVRVAQAVEIANWFSAFGLGLACAVVSRNHSSDETEIAFTACLLSALAQLPCALKTYYFLDADGYSQDTGEAVGF